MYTGHLDELHSCVPATLVFPECQSRRQIAVTVGWRVSDMVVIPMGNSKVFRRTSAELRQLDKEER
jgi:hypothetical protein